MAKITKKIVIKALEAILVLSPLIASLLPDQVYHQLIVIVKAIISMLGG